MSARVRRGRPFVLAIGGLDPSCGAGIAADVRSIDAMGAMPLAVATALTVQSGTGVRRSTRVSADLVLAQLDELMTHLPVHAIKLGQIPSASLARRVAARLADIDVPIVVDPVMRATGGGRLADDAAIAASRRFLVPLATLLTVNLREASVLTGRRVTTVSSMRVAGTSLRAMGAGAVLVKGGHLEGDPIDVLVRDGRTSEIASRRVAASMHGTGCALASAAAARLAHGDSIDVAVRRAREHVRRLLATAQKTGRTTFRSSGSR